MKKKIPERIKIGKWKVENGRYQATVEANQDTSTLLAELIVKFNELISYLESQEKI